MAINNTKIEKVLAFEAGELNDAEALHIQNELQSNDELESLLQSWRFISELSSTDDSIEPPVNILNRAMQIPAIAITENKLTLKDHISSLLETIDSYVANLIQDDRVSPLSVRSGGSKNVHQVWEAGEFDIDLVAEHEELRGGEDLWTLRGQVMSDSNLEGLEISILESTELEVVATDVLNENGFFTMQVPNGQWGLRIGTIEKNVTLNPVILE